ncbi:MAG: FAD-binding oxidoreductase [Hyphomicrobium sp.]|nr:FAD-binding oxidoreductase [Hyphomicrobium sp.]
MTVVTSRDAETIIIGGGLVGTAIAYGLARQGCKPLVLDGGDRDIRAARANFGIIWVQGKGPGMPAYQRLTRRSSDLWPDFARDLSEFTGIALDYRRTGGLSFCLGADGFSARSTVVRRMSEEFGEAAYDTEMIERRAVERLLPNLRLGQDVVGAVHCGRDGEVNPLRLLYALQTAITTLGGSVLGDENVTSIVPRAGTFNVTTATCTYHTPKLILAAGNGTRELAQQVELDIPIRPQRGQLLVTERLAPIFPLPTVPLRQTAEGSILIGSTQEEVGFDTGTNIAGAGRMAERACRILPALENVNIVRHWAGLRVMTPDGHPIYAQSPAFPGAFCTICHSGVTLAAAHALEIAAALMGDVLPDHLKPFHPDRFHVSAAN